MRHNDPSQARQLLTVATMAAITATVVFSVTQPQASRPVSLASLPSASMLGASWAHDDSLPNIAETLNHETLADEEPASTF